MLNFHRHKISYVRTRRDGKMLSGHKQDDNDTVGGIGNLAR